MSTEGEDIEAQSHIVAEVMEDSYTTTDSNFGGQFHSQAELGERAQMVGYSEGFLILQLAASASELSFRFRESFVC